MNQGKVSLIFEQCFELRGVLALKFFPTLQELVDFILLGAMQECLQTGIPTKKHNNMKNINNPRKTLVSYCVNRKVNLHFACSPFDTQQLARKRSFLLNFVFPATGLCAVGISQVATIEARLLFKNLTNTLTGPQNFLL